MASPYLPTEQAVAQSSPEVLGIERQRKLADLLTAQGFNQPQGQMISGHYVAPSWTQQLAPMANVLAGNAISGRADVKQQELATALRGKQAAEIEKFGELEAQDKSAALRYALSTDNPILRSMAQEQLKGIKLGAEETFTRPSLSGGTVEMQGAPKMSDTMRNYQLAKQQGFPGTFIDYQMALKPSPVSVSVNTGQHGFDNALKLRENFKSEPIYKGFSEVESAYNQIKQASAMKSPAGDLAAATKVMKILDPGSVVRESELGLAMQATGVEDRVRNYAQMVINGTKLTPKQRDDFVTLSEKLTNAAGNQFNTKRNEYAEIAKANGLSVEASVPPEAKLNIKPAGKSDVRSMADQILMGK
jgi:hypothetical protein